MQDKNKQSATGGQDSQNNQEAGAVELSAVGNRVQRQLPTSANGAGSETIPDREKQTAEFRGERSEVQDSQAQEEAAQINQLSTPQPESKETSESSNSDSDDQAA